MSFVNDLDISEEETEFQQLISNSRFKCVVSSELLAIPAKTVLDFRRITDTGTQYSVLRVEWRHKFPQPFGFHVIPSGSWNISGVCFGGSLVRKACRLHTVEKVLHNNKSQLTSSGSREQIAQLEKQIQDLQEELRVAQASAQKAKRKLKDLRAVISSAKDQAEALTQEPDTLIPKEDSQKPKKDGSNDILFKSWADSGNAD